MFRLHVHRAQLARGRDFTISIVAALLAGCASYVPHPLDPPATERAFNTRQLDDPGLLEFVRAQPAECTSFPPERWGLDELSFVAWWFNGDMAVARARREAARASCAEQRAPRNPTLGFDLERVTSGGPKPWALGFTFDIPLDLAGRREARGAVAEQVANAADLSVLETAWHVRSALRRALAQRVFAERDLALARELVAGRTRAVAEQERALALGESARGVTVKAHTNLAQAEVELATAEGNVRAARTDLARALGLPEAALTGIELAEPADTVLPEPPQREAARAAGLVNRSDLRAALVDYARAEAALRLEVANQYPEVDLLPGYQWDQGAQKLRFGFSLPLPLFDDHGPAIARALAERAESETRFVALQEHALGEIESARSRYASLKDERASLESALRAAARQLRGSEAAFDAGALSRGELLDEQLARIALDRTLLDVERRADAALAALEDALQCPLASVTVVRRVQAEVSP